MSFMDGLIILSSNGRPLITSRFSSSSSSSSHGANSASSGDSDAGASANGSGFSGARAVYARIHVDRFNAQVLHAIQTSAHARLARPRRTVAPAHKGPHRTDRAVNGKGKCKATTAQGGSGDDWFGSVVLQEAFAGQSIQNAALEGADPLGRDEAEEDYGYAGEEEEDDPNGMLAQRMLPATDYELPRILNLDDVPPVLWVHGVPPLNACANEGNPWRGSGQSCSVTNDENSLRPGTSGADQRQDTRVDLLAPTPAPLSDHENIWQKQQQQQQGELPPSSAAPAPNGTTEDEGDLWDPLEARSEEGGTCLIHKRHNDLHFLIPVSSEVPPLLPLTFLSHFIRLLVTYVSPMPSSSQVQSANQAHLLTTETIKANFDIIYALLEEILDDGGAWPLTTDEMILREIVPAEQGGWRRRAEVWAEKLGASLSAQHGPSAAAVINAAINSPVPWRMPTLRYSNNEIYIDVVERLEGTVGRDDHLRRANLYATVVCRSRLSGMPEILIALSKAELLRDASLHPCVRGRRWQQEQILSFIPPDGSVELASFRVGDAHSVALFEPAQQGGAGASPSLPPPMSSPAGNLENAAPLSCHCWMRGGLLNLDPDGDGAMRTVEFEIEIEPRLQQDRHLQEIVVSFELPEDATNVDAVLIGEGSSSAAQRDVGSAGTFMYDSSLHVFRWSIGSLRRSSLARAKGSFETYSIAPRPASSATVQFQVGMHGLSGVRVDSLTLQGEGYKPFKGVRNVLVGDLEYRWS